MKGWKTLAFNGLAVIGGAALTWAAGIDWTQYASPTAAMLIVGAVNVALRLVTNTAPGQK